jgi:hypothetical protein
VNVIILNRRPPDRDGGAWELMGYADILVQWPTHTVIIRNCKIMKKDGRVLGFFPQIKIGETYLPFVSFDKEQDLAIQKRLAVLFSEAPAATDPFEDRPQMRALHETLARL